MPPCLAAFLFLTMGNGALHPGSLSDPLSLPTYYLFHILLMSSQALKGHVVPFSNKNSLHSDITGCNDYTLNEMKTLRGDYTT